MNVKDLPWIWNWFWSIQRRFELFNPITGNRISPNWYLGQTFWHCIHGNIITIPVTCKGEELSFYIFLHCHIMGTSRIIHCHDLMIRKHINAHWYNGSVQEMASSSIWREAEPSDGIPFPARRSDIITRKLLVGKSRYQCYLPHRVI